MKLDATDLRYLSDDIFRTLLACEMGSKNHEVVPSALISQISSLRSGGANKCLGELAKRNLVARVQGARYDGYRLTYGGYDYLAMRTFARRDTLYSVGNQIGTGKESDIYVVADEEGEQMCCKIHRLGRLSFRTIKSKRDYLRQGQSTSWMYMSRLAAQKEYAFMKVLHENGFPVPKPIDQNRHCVVMELIDAFPLRQISEIAHPGALYSSLMDLIVKLAKSGLIHGDFNEFNILLKESEDPDVLPEPILIDFPQMVSTDHENAEYYFNRDVECIRTFFQRRFRYESAVYPRFSTEVKDGVRDFHLDVEVSASGWRKADEDQLTRFMDQTRDEKMARDAAEIDGVSDDEEGEAADGGVAEADQLEASSSEVEEEDGSIAGSEDDEEDGSEADDACTAPKAKRRPKRAVEEASKDVESLVATSLQRRQQALDKRHHSKASNSRALGRSKGSKKKANKQVLASIDF